MGIVTRTIQNAASDLFHWMILFSMVFFLYVYMAFLIFGSSILSFSTVERSFQTCFGILLGEISVTNEMFNLPNRYSVYIFYYSFIMIVFFVLVNVFLAIIVDAYVDVKQRAENSDSLPKEVVVLIRSLIKSAPCFRLHSSSYLADRDIRRLLQTYLEESKRVSENIDPGGFVTIDGCKMDYSMLHSTIIKEIQSLRIAKRTSPQRKDIRTNKKHLTSPTMADLLASNDSEDFIEELGMKIAENVVHRYGTGRRRASKYKVEPSDFSVSIRHKRSEPFSPLAEETQVPPLVKVEETLESLKQKIGKRESLDSLDKLLDDTDDL